ncbi:MAG: LON peptidase substrate-binding domain-containing protein [Proteobacteria bacterium]|nr:LON peptidase substrate-binding domain-containing protein [Pseudomonadota bacterium]
MNSGAPDSPLNALPGELPLFPLNGVLLLPRGTMPLNVFEPRYLAMVDAALAGGRMIGIIQPAADGTVGLSAPDGTNLYRTGCVGRITGFQETEDGRYLIELRGICRFNVSEELELRDGYRRVRPDYAPYHTDLSPDEGATIERDRLLSGLRGYFEQQNIAADWDSLIKTPDERLVTTLSMVCPFDPAEKQVLLEADDLPQRCKLLIGFVESALRADNDNGNTALN